MAWGRQAGVRRLTFPQGVQTVEHEVIDGASDDAVVQRSRAAPSGQHRRELSKGRAGQASVGPCPGQGKGCRRASPLTCLLPTDTIFSPVPLLSFASNSL